MKTFLKIILMVIIVLALLGVAQFILKVNFVDYITKFLGSTTLASIRTNLGQDIVTPKFEIVSLEIFYPKNLSVIEANKFEWWRLNIGTVFIFVEYDTYLRLGMRNPSMIRLQRIDNTVYVDESSIVIELLDARLSNFNHIRTFTSNPLVLNRNSETFMLQALNTIEIELIEKITENGQSNFEYAKRNFMGNYENLCRSMGLNVVWR